MPLHQLRNPSDKQAQTRFFNTELPTTLSAQRFENILKIPHYDVYVIPVKQAEIHVTIKSSGKKLPDVACGNMRLDLLD